MSIGVDQESIERAAEALVKAAEFMRQRMVDEGPKIEKAFRAMGKIKDRE
jgi:hypothetical protein